LQTAVKIALVGAGHAHLLALPYLAKSTVSTECVLIDPGLFRYSGMATGVLSGQYTSEQASVDPKWICERYGIKFVAQRVEQINRSTKTLNLDDGTQYTYSALSLNIGSCIERKQTCSQQIYPIKPIRELERFRSDLLNYADCRSGELKFVVVGAGPSGCEVALCLSGLIKKMKLQATIVLLSRNQIAPELPLGVQNSLRQALTGANIELLENQAVRQYDDKELCLESGKRIRFDMALLATGLKAPKLIETLGLAHSKSGLQVNAKLHSPEDETVFATGDCADFLPKSLDKAGVYAVRAAPILAHNLEATIKGEALRQFEPQEKYLSIINLGDEQALAFRGNWHWRGYMSLKLKDWIDQRFIHSLK